MQNESAHLPAVFVNPSPADGYFLSDTDLAPKMNALFLPRGHGTYVDEEKLTASVAGEVQRVDKLICVRPLKTR